MHNKIFLTVCLVVASLVQAQSQATDLRASFVAVIVTDMEASSKWYQQVLTFQEEDRTENADFGLVQVNLRRNAVRMELIELKTAIDPYQVLGDTGKGKRLTGLFKVGFSVKDFDAWIEQLNSNQIKVEDEIVIDPLTGGRMVIIRDPDGNRIQLFEEVEGEK